VPDERRRISCGEIIGKVDPIDHDGSPDEQTGAGVVSLLVVGHCRHVGGRWDYRRVHRVI